MASLERIKRPIHHQMIRYEQRLNVWLNSDYGAVSDILQYILTTRGKGIRPLLVMLSHNLHTTDEQRAALQDKCFISAMMIEMIHTASLLHDDVIDEAYTRRGKLSVNAIWRSKSAILAGDYILAKIYSIGLENKEFEIVAYVTKAMEELCNGEFIQNQQSKKLRMTRDIYFDIIHKKTAILIGASSATGAIAAGESTEVIERMKNFGHYIGMAFQIKDDILDFQPSSQIGKPTGIDIRERKITLPLLTVLEKASKSEHTKIISLLSNVRGTPANADKIIKLVLDGGGIEMAIQIMNEYIEKAKQILEPYVDSDTKRAMIELCDYVAERKK